MKRSLTVTIICKVQNTDKDNHKIWIQGLKKTNIDNDCYGVLPNNTIKYEIKRALGWDFNFRNENGKVGFPQEAEIDKYPVMDLFGYVKKNTNKIGFYEISRTAPVRVSNLTSLSPINVDKMPLFTYTVTIDLASVGKDDNSNVEISNEEKFERIIHLLDVIKCLSLNFHGKYKELTPVFMIGGVYEIKNPYFLRAVKTKNGNLNCERIKDFMEITYDAKNNTMLAGIDEVFANNDEVNTLITMSIDDMFSKLKESVREIYIS